MVQEVLEIHVLINIDNEPMKFLVNDFKKLSK